MPKLRDLGVLAWQFWRVLDWRPIQREAEAPLRLALLGTGPTLERLAALLAAAEPLRGPLDLPLPDPPPDLVVLAPPAADEAPALARRQAALLAARDAATLLVWPRTLGADALATPHVLVDPDAPAPDDQLAPALLAALPAERRIAAARRAPFLRAPLARQLLLETAFANAQFALMANLPALLPGVGSVAAVGADLIVLTTNQIGLVYKMAAVWGADLVRPRALLAAVAPVVGGAFLWRTAARAAVGAVPPFAALAPKVAIAYLGTYVVGALASHYYQHGLRPSAERVREIEAEARAALAAVWHRLRPARASEAPGPPAPAARAP
jgi:uncharacterized protein (DUF697 family)